MELYKKYRPSDFDDILSNREAVKFLESEAEKDDPSHAYLFIGEHGCGKTTLAKIMGRVLGCTGQDFREYDTADFRGIDTIREILKQSRFRSLKGGRIGFFLDECFAKGTRVQTLFGPYPIENVEKGWTVMNLAGEGKVKNKFANCVVLSRVVRVTMSDGSFIFTTKEHLFLTNEGWIPAGKLTKKHFTFRFARNITTPNLLRGREKDHVGDSTLPGLPCGNAVLPQSAREVQQEVLQSKLFSQRQDDPPGNQESSVQRKDPNEDSSRTEVVRSFSGGEEKQGETIRENEQEQSNVFSKNSGKDDNNQTTERDTPCLERGTGWEREDNRTPEVISNKFGMAHGSSYSHRTRADRSKRVSIQLQSGCGQFGSKDCDRSRRSSPSWEEEYFRGREEDPQARELRVESVEIYEPGHNDESFQSVIDNKAKTDGFVVFFDLEVEGHPSYFAENLPVHNCHQISKDGQEALLKGLEQAPDNVFYFLATTDPQKLKPTLKSRCKLIQVQPLNDKQMYKLLRRTIKEEKEELDSEVLEQIIADSVGHPRDALQILEQVLAVEPERRLKAAQRAAELQEDAIQLCRLLIKNADWDKVRAVLNNIKDQDPERVRHLMLSYCGKVLLGGANHQAAAIMEEFKDPFYANGFNGLILACYAVTS